VDFTTTQQAFADPKAPVLFHQLHSNARELRWWLLGKVGARILLLRYTHRPHGVICLIGAGYWREGRACYQNHQKNQNR
jgi:uncharacterized DUF497 family protein